MPAPLERTRPTRNELMLCGLIRRYAANQDSDIIATVLAAYKY